MKRILITGANSYIGTSFEAWMKQYRDSYVIETVDTITEAWKVVDFSQYDVVFHVAGIAHIKETKEDSLLYYKVNRDLACDVAKKAKCSGVKQLIFLSSMSIYGLDIGVINQNTKPNPRSNYGISKLQAEECLKTLRDENFKVAILRPPMVYGKGCRGNYQRLVNFALKYSVFPDVSNKRSMIYIDNLCEFIRLVIDDGGSGLFFPQNEAYVNTSELVKVISKTHGRRIILTKIFNPIIELLKYKVALIGKVFGSLVYEMDMSDSNIKGMSAYCLVDFNKSIEVTEGKHHDSFKKY